MCIQTFIEPVKGIMLQETVVSPSHKGSAEEKHVHRYQPPEFWVFNAKKGERMSDGGHRSVGIGFSSVGRMMDNNFVRVMDMLC